MNSRCTDAVFPLLVCKAWETARGFRLLCAVQAKYAKIGWMHRKDASPRANMKMGATLVLSCSCSVRFRRVRSHERFILFLLMYPQQKIVVWSILASLHACQDHLIPSHHLKRVIAPPSDTVWRQAAGIGSAFRAINEIPFITDGVSFLTLVVPVRTFTVYLYYIHITCTAVI